MMAQPISSYNNNSGPATGPGHPSVNIVKCDHFLSRQFERISLLNNNNSKEPSGQELCWSPACGDEGSCRNIRESNDARPSWTSPTIVLTPDGPATESELARPELRRNTNQNFLLEQLLRVPEEEDLRKRAVYPASPTSSHFEMSGAE